MNTSTPVTLAGLENAPEEIGALFVEYGEEFRVIDRNGLAATAAANGAMNAWRDINDVYHVTHQYFGNEISHTTFEHIHLAIEEIDRVLVEIGMELPGKTLPPSE